MGTVKRNDSLSRFFPDSFCSAQIIRDYKTQTDIILIMNARACVCFLSVCSSKRLVTLARGLSPAFLRFGGKRTDFLQFNNQKNLAKFRGPGPDYYLKNYEDGDHTGHFSLFQCVFLTQLDSVIGGVKLGGCSIFRRHSIFNSRAY